MDSATAGHGTKRDRDEEATSELRSASSPTPHQRTTIQERKKRRTETIGGITSDTNNQQSVTITALDNDDFHPQDQQDMLSELLQRREQVRLEAVQINALKEIIESQKAHHREDLERERKSQTQKIQEIQQTAESSLEIALETRRMLDLINSPAVQHPGPPISRSISHAAEDLPGSPTSTGTPIAVNIDETNAHWDALVSALYSPVKFSRDTAKASAICPVHWEVISSSVADITTCSTVESACLSLINDQTDDIRVLCRKLNQVSALVYQASQLNCALFDVAMRVTVDRILESENRSEWSGIDIKALIYTMRQAVNAASIFGLEELWDFKLDVAFQWHADFASDLEEKRWSSFGLAMDQDVPSLWNHFSKVGISSRGLDAGFFPCSAGRGWVVADFIHHRLYFLGEDSVSMSSTDSFGVFTLHFVVTKAGSEDTHHRMSLTGVSARQVLKRSKINLEEWYDGKLAATRI